MKKSDRPKYIRMRTKDGQVHTVPVGIIDDYFLPRNRIRKKLAKFKETINGQ